MPTQIAPAVTVAVKFWGSERGGLLESVTVTVNVYVVTEPETWLGTESIPLEVRFIQAGRPLPADQLNGKVPPAAYNGMWNEKNPSGKEPSDRPQAPRGRT